MKPLHAKLYQFNQYWRYDGRSIFVLFFINKAVILIYGKIIVHFSSVEKLSHYLFGFAHQIEEGKTRRVLTPLLFPLAAAKTGRIIWNL
jgi:hypothetical protein